MWSPALIKTQEPIEALASNTVLWVKFPAEDFKKVLLNYGFADGAANDYVEMFATLDTGLLFEDIQKTKPKIEGTSIEEFAITWAAAYR